MRNRPVFWIVLLVTLIFLAGFSIGMQVAVLTDWEYWGTR